MFLKYALLADTVTLDASGKATAVGIFDIIYAVGFPVLQRDMSLIALLEGTAAEKDEYKLTVELRDEKANKFASFEQTIKLAPTPNRQVMRARVLVRIQDLPFVHPGEYEFVMFINDRFLGRTTFSVKATGPIEKSAEEE
jgi:hypothetical protein